MFLTKSSKEDSTFFWEWERSFVVKAASVCCSSITRALNFHYPHEIFDGYFLMVKRNKDRIADSFPMVGNGDSFTIS